MDSKDVPNTNGGFSTPEDAILRLEDAYRAKDIQACVSCKDFRIEARLMLEQIMNRPGQKVDDEMLAKTAEVLELAFRKQIKDNGFPNMTGVRSTFPKKEPGGTDIVIVTEVCHYPDGGTSTQRILVAKTDKGWRVLNPVK